jgi:TolB-like protein/class 3 adenylate cyclase
LAEEEPLDEFLKRVFNGGRRGRRRLERRLAALLAIDVAGYSLLMGRDEEGTHRRIGEALDRVRRQIRRADGRIFSFSGDGLMAAFPSCVTAVRCAVQIQAESATSNADVAPQERIAFRIGLSVGEIVVQGGRVGGDAVNIAARLEQLADTGGVYITAAVHEQGGKQVGVSFERLGEQQLKNIRQPVVVYRVVPTSTAGPLPPPATTAASAVKDPRPWVAILPFSEAGGATDETYFAHGIVEDMIVSLTGLRELVVISRSSAVALAERNVDIREMGRTLGVGYIVTGSSRRTESSLRLRVQLTEVESGATLWASSYDHAIGELFAVQDQIVRQIVSGVAPNIQEEELRRALRRHPENMTAYDLTLRALHLMEQLRPAIFGQARPLLAQAMEIDPKFAMPVAWGAWWHVRWVGQGWSNHPDEDARQAAILAKRAVELDPHDALALSIQGHVHSFILHDYDSALSYFERAMVAGPNRAIVVMLHALTLAYVGRGAEAVQLAEYGLQLSPLDRRLFLFHNVLAWCHYSNGTFQDAVRWARLSANEAPEFTANLRVLIASLVAIGEACEARMVAARMLELEPAFTFERYIVTRQPFRDGPIKTRYITHLRGAALPS